MQQSEKITRQGKAKKKKKKGKKKAAQEGSSQNVTIETKNAEIEPRITTKLMVVKSHELADAEALVLCHGNKFGAKKIDLGERMIKLSTIISRNKKNNSDYPILQYRRITTWMIKTSMRK